MADNRTMAEMLRAPPKGVARRWLKKEPPCSITTWDDLAWDRYKDLLRACPHHGFTELHRLDTFYNALNPADQDSLNDDASPVKAVEDTCVTCGGAHPYYQCLAAGGNTFPEFRDNIQGYVSAAACNYNQGNPGYHPQGVANQMRPPGFAQPNVQNNQNRFGPPQRFNHGNNFNQEQSYQATAQPNQNFHLNELEKIKRMNETSLSNQTNEIKNMMASLLLINTASTSGSGSLPSNTIANPKGKLKGITTRSGLVTNGPTVPTPPKSVTPEVGERVEETYTDPDLAEYTIKVPPPPSPLILGRPFLRTARALIDVHGEEIILRNGDERLTLNIKHDTASYSNHLQRESVNLINIFNVSDIDSINDIHPQFDDNPLSGSTTYFLNSFLEEFTDELALITYPLNYDDNLQFDIESNLIKIEFLLYQGKDFYLKDSIDQTDLANLDDYFVDPTPEMFTDEHAPDYSSPPRFDVYDDDFLEDESDADNAYDDPFDSKGEKIKESKLLIDELDLPCDFLPYSEYDSLNSQDFSRVDALPSTNNEDKVFNPGNLIQEEPFKIITRVVQDKKLEISDAFLVLEDFDPSFYEPLFFKDVPKSYTSKKVHCYFLPELSHPGYHVFKVNQIFISMMKIFLVQCGKNTPILDVPLFHFYPP
nr:hypothetical protein [Tanacetum cinerariifolium]